MRVLRGPVDTDEDNHEDVSFKVQFCSNGLSSDANRPRQTVQVHRAVDGDAAFGLGADIVASGDTCKIVNGDNGVRVVAGVTRGLFTEDAAALLPFEAAFAKGRHTPTAFDNSRSARPTPWRLPKRRLGGVEP
jgi:hypothetical protein